MHEKCKQCAKNNPNDEVRVRMGFDTPYGCYHDTDECTDPKYPEFEPITPEKPEPEPEWTSPADCDDCVHWGEDFETTGETAGNVSKNCLIGGRCVGCTCCHSTWRNKEYCDKYEQKEPEKEKSWEWEADCGDCIYIKTITEDVKGTQKGRIAACKIPHVGGYCVKCVDVPPDYWYRMQRVDFHDCEGYTPPERDIRGVDGVRCQGCANAFDFGTQPGFCKCKTDPNTDDPDYVHWATDKPRYCDKYIPRSCENCGSRKPHEFGVGGTCCSVAEYPRCNEDRSWRSWTPKPEKEPEKPEIALPDGSERCEWDLVNNVLTFHFACRTCGKYTNRKYPLTTTAVVIGLSCKECEDNEEVIKEKIKENKEVTEMNKSEEKFPFTCPACGHGDDEQGNYCPECGVSVNEMIPQRRVEMMDNDYTWHPDPLMEQQIRDALHIPEKKERTRKAVRVKESKRKTFYLYVGFLMVDIAVAILSLVVGFWTNTIYMTVISIFGIWGLSSIVEFVDVPRVPTIDRLRAWKQARKDTRMAELERENEILCGDNKLAEVNLRGQEMITEEWKQTAANLTKQHEQDIKDITEERDAMVNTILTDRDANWIPLSNRLSAGIGADDVVINIDGPYKTVECTIYDRDGKLSKTLVDFTEIVLFSRDALPENKDCDD